MRLLAPRPTSELPMVALLARLRYRRATLVETAAGWQTPEAEFMAAVDWVDRRLDRHHRLLLTPYLELLSMRQLVLLLRYRLVREEPPLPLLRAPLLNPDLVAPVLNQVEPRALVENLEWLLTPDYPFAAGMTGVYLDQGPGGLEQRLTAGVLTEGAQRSRNRVVELTLRYLLDLRNLMTLLKCRRWQVRAVPEFAEGGDLPRSSLIRAMQRQDEGALERLVRSLTGRPEVALEAVALEPALFEGLSRRLRRVGRDPLGLGLVLDYLWRLQVVASNRTLALAVDIDRDDLMAEGLMI